MPPVRVPIPPYLLNTSWASTSLPPRFLRAVLQLPGELRPIALRSYHSIACRAQSQHITSHAVQYDIPLHGVNRNHVFLGEQAGEDGKGDDVGRGIELSDKNERTGRKGKTEQAKDSGLSMGNGTSRRLANHIRLKTASVGNIFTAESEHLAYFSAVPSTLALRCAASR
jgi:hypothetical protein